MNNSLKQRTGFAIFWSFIDKGGQQLMQLVFTIVLARILLPEDVGTFALLAIFTAVANILQESGFSAALIRKKDPDTADFSSVFYFNIGISILIYLLFFFSAPLISWFYDKPILTDLSRVVFLAFLFNAFGIIQNVTLIRAMDFKTNTRITLIAASISGVLAIGAAYYGFGIWSLVIQLVVQSFLRNALLWLSVRWRPQSGLSFTHLKAMIPYSSKLLLTSLMNQVVGNLYTNIIGKIFNDHQAGIYSYANKVSVIPQSVISDGIKSAAFPALTKTMGDIDYTKKAFRKIVRIVAFISFPIAVLTIVVAQPAILILFTNKWEESIVLLQILTVGIAFYPLYSLTATLLQTIGKTSLIFKLETFRNILALCLILFTIKYGVTGLVAGISIAHIMVFTVGMIATGKHIKYSFAEVLKDISPYLVVAIISIVPFYFIRLFEVNNLYALLLIPTIAGLSIYLGVLKIAGSVILDDSIGFLRQQLSNFKK